MSVIMLALKVAVTYLLYVASRAFDLQPLWIKRLKGYAFWRGAPKWSKTQGDRNELITLKRSLFLLYPSQWTSDSARLYCNRFINCHSVCAPEKLINEYYSTKSIAFVQGIVVIYVSGDWKRKNGDKAIDVCRLLIAAGIQTRLILVGQIPEHARHINFVDYRGFLRKSDPAQLAELCRAYREAHFLLAGC
jgi:hypothetical protein